jgi:hypothetical protein
LSVPDQAIKIVKAWKKQDNGNPFLKDDKSSASADILEGRVSRSSRISTVVVRESHSVLQCTIILTQRHFYYTMKSVHGFFAVMVRSLGGCVTLMLLMSFKRL